jgi:hypothetical protein
VDNEFKQIKRQLKLLAFTAALTAGALVWVALRVSSAVRPETTPIWQILQTPEAREIPERPQANPEIPLILVKPVVLDILDVISAHLA